MVFRSAKVVLILGSLTTTWAFLPHHRPTVSSSVGAPRPIVLSQVVASRTSTSQLFSKLWERMGIEEDEESMWYVLNCVAGLEIDLLRMCRQRCDEMEDVEKFVVPMITTTRSHGANRMVKDVKVKYQGYVFAKLRLCPETYEVVQEMDLCRSWMGTINIKGHKKLPPSPVALNEQEIENFDLEALESAEPEEAEDDGIILDTADNKDNEAAEMEQTVQRVYLGLRVDDMVKVTAKNKFFDEDAIVRRLKDDKLFLRFYTYGTMFEEWMDPADVRKLTDTEILKGLSGPQQPITQHDIDGSDGGQTSRYGDDRRDGPGRRNMVSERGDTRNRRQDREVGKFQRDSDRNDRGNEENWNRYKDSERRSNNGDGYKDGEYEMRGSRENQKDNKGRRDNQGAESDVDSQWGRTTQRENRREKSPRKQSGDDWSSFVSPAKPALNTPSQAETDDFFASLMTDLSNDLDSVGGSQKGSKDSPKGGGDVSAEDDFFASLMSEIGDDGPAKAKKEPEFSASSDDDFFASLEEEIRGPPTLKPATKKPPSASDELDDFFSELGAFDEPDQSSTPSSKDDPDDFFAGLEAELESQLSMDAPLKKEASTESSKTDDDAFLDDFLGDFDGSIKKPVEKNPEKKSPKMKQQEKVTVAASPASNTVDPAGLQKYTVPVLKEMLRERGMKVSGKKSELIDRLSA